MKNKNLLYGIGAVILIIIIVISFNYWQKGTPSYSFKQLQSAFNNHDTEKFNKYFDTDQIFESYFKRNSAKIIDQIKLTSDSEFAKEFQIAQVNSSATTSKQSFEQQIYDNVSGKIIRNEDSSEYKGFLSIFLNSKPKFNVNDKVATANVLFENYTFNNPDNYPVYNFKVIFKQQDDGFWKITDIQGYEDYTTGIDDYIREKDLKITLGNLINGYISDGEKPTLTNDNWRKVLKNYSNKIGGASFLPEDPIASYSDKNKYQFTIINADSLKNYSYVLRAKFSTIDNTVFKRNAFLNLSYSDTYKRLGNGDIKNVLSLDCTAPAYCYSGWGLDSDWQKVLTK